MLRRSQMLAGTILNANCESRRGALGCRDGLICKLHLYINYVAVRAAGSWETISVSNAPGSQRWRGGHVPGKSNALRLYALHRLRIMML